MALQWAPLHNLLLPCSVEWRRLEAPCKRLPGGPPCPPQPAALLPGTPGSGSLQMQAGRRHQLGLLLLLRSALLQTTAGELLYYFIFTIFLMKAEAVEKDGEAF